MDHEVRSFPNPVDLATASAVFVAEIAHRCVEDRGEFNFFVSGGRTPWAMFDDLAARTMPWEQTVVYQVDERVAPNGDEDRNLTHLSASLGELPVRIVAMPVGDSDLDAAADRYGAQLPARFDLVHLGLGPDGHTASLLPGDPVLDVADRLVAITGTYQGRRRMTLTYPALARAEQLMWLVAGDGAREPLAQLLSGDSSIPAGRVEAARSLVMTDVAPS